MNRNQWLTSAYLTLREELYPDSPTRVKIIGNWDLSPWGVWGQGIWGNPSRLYVSAHITEGWEVLGVMLHEAVHIKDHSKHGHGKHFVRRAIPLGFRAPFDHFTPSDELQTELKILAGRLGPIPEVAQENLRVVKSR